MEDVRCDNSFDLTKSFLYSIIGIIIFFIPIKIDGQTLTTICHIAYKMQITIRPFIEISIVSCILLSILKLIFNYKNKIDNNVNFKIFLRVMTLVIIVNIFYGNKNLFFIREDVMFIIDDILLNLVTMLPLGAVFMTFITDYGILDVVESYTHKFMKNMFKLSGKTLVNIFIFIFTDYFVGLFMTSRLYNKGKIRESEACILVVNFSVINFQMLNYITSELELNKLDIILINMLILVVINMILCRVYPLNKKKKSYFIKTQYRETTHKKYKFKKGVDKYIKNKEDTNIFKNIFDSLEESIYIIIELIPLIIIVICVGDIVVRSPYIVNCIGYILHPILNIIKVGNIGEISNFITIAFFNDVVALDMIKVDLEYGVRLLLGLIVCSKCISISSGILFTSHTNININISEFILIYLERIFLIVSIYFLMYYFYIGYVM